MPFKDSPGLTTNTADGGIAIWVINDTGGASVEGVLLEASSSVVRGASTADADSNHTIGVTLKSGIANGDLMQMVIMGYAKVALKDNTAGTLTNWVKVSDEAGYADATNAAPPGSGVVDEIDNHFREIGHCSQTIAATGGGTHVLALCFLHYN